MSTKNKIKIKNKIFFRLTNIFLYPNFFAKEAGNGTILLWPYNTLVLRNIEITAPSLYGPFDFREEKWWQFQFVNFNVIFYLELALHLSETKDVNVLLGPNIRRHAACRISIPLLFYPGVRALVTSWSNLAIFMPPA